MSQISMYPPQRNGVARVPTKAEVLAYFAHPSSELDDAFDFWQPYVRNQRRQLAHQFTVEEVATVHPEHRALFIVYSDYMAEAFPQVN